MMKKALLLMAQWWKKYFVIWLALFVLISYGQTLKMDVWKDDNAIFFKFTHLEEEAGYLGKGWWGSGPYKFTVAPYLLVYRLFGYESIAPYYALTLIFYYLSALSVYLVFSEMLSPEAGRAAGWLYACGYIASEGFVWLASAMILNVSVILSCLVLYWYFKYLRLRRTRLYFMSLLFYGLAIFWTPVRIHYLIVVLVAVVALGDYLWGAGKVRVKNIGRFVVRVTPFLGIFYWYVRDNKDPRVGLSFLELLQEVGRGQIYGLSSFFGSLGYMVLPDRQADWISGYLRKGGGVSVWMSEFGVGVMILLAVVIVILARARRMVQKRVWVMFIGISGVWLFLARRIGLAPQVNADTNGLIAIFVGGLFLELLASLIWRAERKTKCIIVFLLVWLLTNLIVYTSYQPMVIYPSFDRYLAHSFVPLVGLGGMAFINRKNISWRTILLRVTVIFWGIMNLYNSAVYQREVVLERSQSARRFYTQLKEYLPEMEKGSVLYFDVDDSELKHFNAAFSVGQMPETTALAWRYGLDRYDLSMFEDYESAVKEIQDRQVDLDKVFSFWYSREGLINSTEYFRDYLQNELAGGLLKLDPIIESHTVQEKLGDRNIIKQEDLEILLDGPVIKSVPVIFNFEITATPMDGNYASYPFVFGENALDSGGINKGLDFLRVAVDYGRYKDSVMRTAGYYVSSEWRDRIVDNLHDDNHETVWQADRVLWDTEGSDAYIDLGREGKLSGVVWVNGFANSTPTRYKIEVSSDNKVWKVVREVDEVVKINSGELQIVSFSPVEVRYVRISFLETLNHDSPEIAEFWPIDSKFSEWDIFELEKSVSEVFREVKDRSTYEEIIRIIEKLGEAKVYWLDDNDEWMTSSNVKIEILYDANPHICQILIPAGGLRIHGFRISDFTVPGIVRVERIEYGY